MHAPFMHRSSVQPNPSPVHGVPSALSSPWAMTHPARFACGSSGSQRRITQAPSSQRASDGTCTQTPATQWSSVQKTSSGVHAVPSAAGRWVQVRNAASHESTVHGSPSSQLAQPAGAVVVVVVVGASVVVGATVVLVVGAVVVVVVSGMVVVVGGSVVVVSISVVVVVSGTVVVVSSWADATTATSITRSASDGLMSPLLIV